MKQPLHPNQLRDSTEPSTWRIAIHEAGHAVTAIALDVHFDYVTLHPDDGQTWAAAVVGMRGRTLPAIAVYLAGAIAEAHATGDHLAEMFCANGRCDLARALIHGDGLCAASMTSIARRAERIVCDTHSYAVTAVAEALLKPPQWLPYAKVAALVEDHTPGGLDYEIRRATEHLERNASAANP